MSDSLLVLAATYKRDEYKILTASELDQLSINLSKTSHIGKGFKAGLVTGFCIGVIFSSSDLNRSTETGWSSLANIVLSPKTVVISVVGAGIGSIIGKLASYETWQSIPLTASNSTALTRLCPSLLLIPSNCSSLNNPESKFLVLQIYNSFVNIVFLQ